MTFPGWVGKCYADWCALWREIKGLWYYVFNFSVGFGRAFWGLPVGAWVTLVGKGGQRGHHYDAARGTGADEYFFASLECRQLRYRFLELGGEHLLDR